mmetsp:Transcript_39835/g.78027  ORF Transcript_39835/g.78027 Transcript_39835/m.78027 type:complete len:226 (-) Transcript_39835:3239-3916(-)
MQARDRRLELGNAGIFGCKRLARIKESTLVRLDPLVGTVDLHSAAAAGLVELRLHAHNFHLVLLTLLARGPELLLQACDLCNLLPTDTQSLGSHRELAVGLTQLLMEHVALLLELLLDLFQLACRRRLLRVQLHALLPEALRLHLDLRKLLLHLLQHDLVLFRPLHHLKQLLFLLTLLCYAQSQLLHLRRQVTALVLRAAELGTKRFKLLGHDALLRVRVAAERV